MTEKMWDGGEERVRGGGKRERQTAEIEREREWSKYLQLTDLSKWIRCPVRAVGVTGG